MKELHRVIFYHMSIDREFEQGDFSWRDLKIKLLIVRKGKGCLAHII